MPSEFDESVWRLLRKIPKGKVTTYKIVAAALGKKGAARAVGNACNRNPHAPAVPCHRAVRSDGSVGGYAKGVGKKIAVLKREGIIIKGKNKPRIQNLEGYLYRFI